jgi:hypothetical protein
MEGCQLVLISFAHCGQILWSGDFARYNAVIPRYRQALEAVARERHIPLVTAPILTERSTTPNYELFIDKFHPNREGHALLARAVHEFLRDRGYLPEVGKPPIAASDASLGADSDKE